MSPASEGIDGVTPEEGEDSISETEQVINFIAKSYERHPRVLRAIEQYKTGRPAGRSAITDPTGRYLQEAGQFSLLSHAEEIDLFNTLYSGVQLYFDVQAETQDNQRELTPEEETVLIESAIAFQKIFVSNTRLVISIASKFNMIKTMELTDLITEGNIGLAKAIGKFDVSRGFKFSTMATWWIRQQITRAIGDQSRTVRLPIHRHDAYLKLRKDMKQLSEVLERQATAQDIAEVSGESVQAVEKLLKDGSQEPLSIDAEYDNGKTSTTSDKGTARGDMSHELSESSIDTFADRLAVEEEVKELLTTGYLAERELMILSLRFGLNLPELHGHYIGDIPYEDLAVYDTEHSLEQIGEIFGLTRERIRQIEAKALAKMRAKVDPEVLSAGTF